jgi:hypothetical protein
MNRWFRFYEGALDDPKVQRLSPAVFKGWVNLLCLASKHKGKLPGLADIAFALRISDHEADSLIAALMDVGLIDDVGDGMQPHKWYERQYQDPTNAERQRNFRERNKASVTVTRYDRYGNPLRTDTETDTDKKQNPPSEGNARKRATRLPDGFPSKEEIDRASEKFGSETDWQREAEQFRDRNTATGGTYKDWPAAWRTWCRNAGKWRKPSAAPVNDKYAPFRKILDGTNGNR